MDGGFRFSGHKMFCSLAPVWTRYGSHAMWADADGGPKIVHAFLPRSHDGYRIVETWDTLGMRATKSDDVVLDGAFVPDKYIARIVPAGQVDPFVLGIFAWGLTGFANIYYGVARRAIDLAVAGIKTKTSLAVSRSMAYHPEIQHAVAEMALALDPIEPHIEKLAEDWSAGVDHGGTGRRDRLGQVPRRRGCWRIVVALECRRRWHVPRELERLFRDAAAGASIRRTPSRRTRSSARPRWASTREQRAGGSANGGQLPPRSGGWGRGVARFGNPPFPPPRGRGTWCGATKEVLERA